MLHYKAFSVYLHIHFTFQMQINIIIHIRKLYISYVNIFSILLKLFLVGFFVGVIAVYNVLFITPLSSLCGQPSATGVSRCQSKAPKMHLLTWWGPNPQFWEPLH